MHKSRLAGFIIDCRTDDVHGAASFWSKALGIATEALPGQEGDSYVKLKVPDEHCTSKSRPLTTTAECTSTSRPTTSRRK